MDNDEIEPNEPNEPHKPHPVNDPRTEAVMDRIRDAGEKIGLYSVTGAIMDLRDAPVHVHVGYGIHEDDTPKYLATMMFTVGDRAFADEVQHPDRAAEKKVFDEMRPDSMEMYRQIQQELRDEYGDDEQ